MSRAWTRVLAIGGGTLVGLTALIGFAHTPAGRPLLAALGRPLGKLAGCPLGYDRVISAEERALGRRQFADAHAGTTPALARPALGFTLDGTSRAQLEAWAKDHAVRCQPKRGDVVCEDVPAALLDGAGVAARTLRLTFDERDRLVSIIVVRRHRDVRVISHAYDEVTSEVAREAGAAAKHEGDASAVGLTRGLLNQASAEYRFSNYYMLARATNMGDGYLLTEEYRSLQN